MTTPSAQIVCSACGEDSLVVRTPVYDGFTRTGETLTCACCGHEYASEDEVPFKGPSKSAVFDESDAPDSIDPFKNDERGRLCRYCKHYLVNPFTQKCGLHMRLVEATDSCEAFTPMPEDEADAPQEGDVPPAW